MQIDVTDDGARAHIDTRELDGDVIAYISDVFVPIEVRGQDKGFDIIYKCVSICQSLGVDIIRTHVELDNEPMSHILDRLDFYVTYKEKQYEWSRRFERN